MVVCVVQCEQRRRMSRGKLDKTDSGTYEICASLPECRRPIAYGKSASRTGSPIIERLNHLPVHWAIPLRIFRIFTIRAVGALFRIGISVLLPTHTRHRPQPLRVFANRHHGRGRSRRVHGYFINLANAPVHHYTAECKCYAHYSRATW